MTENHQQMNPIMNLDFEDVLGHGNFGSVVLARHKILSRKVAVKMLSKEKTTRSAIDVEIKANLKMQGVLGTANILEAFEDNKFYYIVSEFAAGKDLFSFVLKNGRFSEEKTKSIFRQLFATITEMHSKCVIHHDIKCENILFDDQFNTVTLVDFGQGQILEDSDHSWQGGASIEYRSPEKLFVDKNGYSAFKSELFSLGVVLYVLIYGQYPWSKKQRTTFLELRFHSTFKLPQSRVSISDDLKDLLEGLLQVDPSKRFTHLNVANHPWLKTDEQKLFENLLHTSHSQQNLNDSSTNNSSIAENLGSDFEEF